jgi:hypothetical protein
MTVADDAELPAVVPSATESVLVGYPFGSGHKRTNGKSTADNGCSRRMNHLMIFLVRLLVPLSAFPLHRRPLR